MSGAYDQGPGIHRIGLIALSNDYTTERDFMNMRPSDDVTVFTSRLHSDPDCSLESLPKMGAQIADATSLLIPEGRLDVVAYSCTSGTAVLGFDKVRQLIQSVRPGIACTTPLTASIEALNAFGSKRVAVLTPYTDEVNEMIARSLEAADKEITSFASFKIVECELMTRVPPEALLRAALAMDTHDADALFISCTALRAVDVVAEIERRLGKPVITAVQALYWHSLRLAGYSKPIDGFGRLFAL
ncbi:hypothetical protein BAE42_30730 [Mesorhizobium loti]|nr:hypothetical protein BAE42_30730 [Mesorhizobium loti]OBQ68273.1 hypothetical protein A8146_12200 [Mesorhizobium loti]